MTHAWLDEAVADCLEVLEKMLVWLLTCRREVNSWGRPLLHWEQANTINRVGWWNVGLWWCKQWLFANMLARCLAQYVLGDGVGEIGSKSNIVPSRCPVHYLYLFNCWGMQISYEPVTLQQLDAFRSRWPAEVKTQHQSGKEKWFKWLWM